MRGRNAQKRPRVVNEPWVWLRMVIGANVHGHRALSYLPRADPDKWVDSEVDVCLEGYPRSGNTFISRAFREWNPEIRIAHHVHVPGQLILAARLGRPAALLIREPVAAAASFMVYWESELSPGVALRAYTDFHRPLLGVLDRIAVCPFERFADDPRYVVEAINERFGTTFHCASLSQGRREALFGRIEAAHRENKRREATFSVPGRLRRDERERARRAVLSSPRLEEAVGLHRRIVAHAA